MFRPYSARNNEIMRTAYVLWQDQWKISSNKVGIYICKINLNLYEYKGYPKGVCYMHPLHTLSGETFIVSLYECRHTQGTPILIQCRSSLFCIFCALCCNIGPYEGVLACLADWICRFVLLQCKLEIGTFLDSHLNQLFDYRSSLCGSKFAPPSGKSEYRVRIIT